jgi:hypothetical protein
MSVNTKGIVESRKLRRFNLNVMNLSDALPVRQKYLSLWVIHF